MTVTADLLKPDASTLASLAMGLGVLELLLSLPALLAPGPVGRVWRAFPRSVWPGRMLAAVALVWSALWLNVMPLGPVTPLKAWLPLLTPVAIVAVALFVDELLACRAVGGLLVLLPAPLLSAAQWHPSPWRYLVLVLAYAMAIKGMFAIALPHRLRDAIFWGTASSARTQALGGVGVLVGLVLIVLSQTAYRLS